MFAAITTRFHGPNYRGQARIKATSQAGSLTIPYDYSGNADSIHAKAAQALAVKLGWRGYWFAGGLPDQSGNVYVCLPLDSALAAAAAFTVLSEGRPITVCVWSAASGFYWDDAEDHGGFDRISPNGAFQTRAAAERDARIVLSPSHVRFVDGRPTHYDEG